jgi:hypothetical protein
LHIHDASQFGALAGPALLTQFAYRPDTIPGQSGPRSFTLRIYASTTSRSVNGLSTTFAENLGTNNTLVFDGTVNVATGNLPGPGNTRQFDYVRSGVGGPGNHESLLFRLFHRYHWQHPG